MHRALLLGLAAAFAAGCACQAPVTPALFVVLPSGADGHVGKIVVTRGEENRVIDTAYGAQRVKSDGTVEAARLSESEVRTTFGPTICFTSASLKVAASTRPLASTRWAP